MYRSLALWVMPLRALAAEPATSPAKAPDNAGAPAAPAPPASSSPAGAEAEPDLAAGTDVPASLQSYQGLGFRMRHLWVPRTIVDSWYFDADDADWPYVEGRPGIQANAYGLEYGVQKNGSNGIFYAEFIDSTMKAGYWDDVEDPPDHLDGDWLAPTAGLGMVAFGADYAYEIHAVRIEDTGGAFGWSFLVGGGLGLGVLTGQLNQWSPDTAGTPGYERYLEGDDPDGTKDLPAAFPMVDVNLGTRLNLGNRAALRFEGGLHTFLYLGGSLGVML